jgi:hypothetical protein
VGELHHAGERAEVHGGLTKRGELAGRST